MFDPTAFDPRPLHARIKDVLRAHPDGLSMKEVGELLHTPTYTAGSVLSKLVAYGAGVEKFKQKGGEPHRYRLTARERAG